VENQLREVLQSEVPLVSEVTQHPLRAGGKRLRPALVLLGGRFHRPEERERLVGLAAAVELIHMATLVHDDVVDQAATRRGHDTVNARWGDRMAVLSGDYVFGCAFTLIARWGTPAVIASLSRCVTEMAKGEMVQFGRVRRFRETEEDYLNWITRKTAIFIAESTQIGAMACGAPDSVLLPLRGYGHALGMCFQIVDDVLDIVGTPETLGKPALGDLKNGVTTLPFIHALRESQERDLLRDLLSDGYSAEAVAEIRDILRRAGSIEYATGRAAAYAARAQRELEKLPDIPARRALSELADHLLHRAF